jgi:hypothetical protein
MHFRNWIRNWLLKPPTVNTKYDNSLPGLVSSHGNQSMLEEGMCRIRFSVIPANGGTIIEQSVYKPNPRGPDWTFSLYIVGPDETVAECIQRLSVINKLEQ